MRRDRAHARAGVRTHYLTGGRVQRKYIFRVPSHKKGTLSARGGLEDAAERTDSALNRRVRDADLRAPAGGEARASRKSQTLPV